jgi:hypothetical protein
MTTEALAEAIRRRLREINDERAQLVALLGYYTNGSKPPDSKTAMPTQPQDESRPFRPKAKGPTERIMAVISTQPGLRYGEVVSTAIEGLETDATNPRRSVGSTLGSLVNRGKVRKDDEGRYFPVDEKSGQGASTP